MRKLHLLMVLAILPLFCLQSQELYSSVQFAGNHSLVYYPTTPLGFDSSGTVELLFRASPLPKIKPKKTRGGLFGFLTTEPAQFSTPSKKDLKEAETAEEVFGASAIFSQADEFNTRFTIFLDETQKHIGLYDGTSFNSVPFDFNDGDFHHVAFSTDAGLTSVVIDGDSITTFTGAYGDGKNLPLHVASSDGNLHQFKGEIYMIRMWNTPLSTTEISQESHQVYGAVPETDPQFENLLLYSEFTESSQKLLLAQDIIYRTNMMGTPGDTIIRHLLAKDEKYTQLQFNAIEESNRINNLTLITSALDTTELPGNTTWPVLDDLLLEDGEYFTGVYGTFDEDTLIRSLRFTTNRKNSYLKPLIGPALSAQVAPTLLDTKLLNPFIGFDTLVSETGGIYLTTASDTLIAVVADTIVSPAETIPIGGIRLLAAGEIWWKMMRQTLKAGSNGLELSRWIGGRKRILIEPNELFTFQTLDTIWRSPRDTTFTADGKIFSISKFDIESFLFNSENILSILPSTDTLSTTAGDTLALSDLTTSFLTDGKSMFALDQDTLFTAAGDILFLSLGDTLFSTIGDTIVFTAGEIFTRTNGESLTFVFADSLYTTAGDTIRFAGPVQGSKSDFAAVPPGGEVVGFEVGKTNNGVMTGIQLLYKKKPRLEQLDLGVWQAKSDLEPIRDDVMARSKQHVDKRDGGIFLHGTYTSNPLYKLSLDISSNDLIIAGEVPRRHLTEDTTLTFKNAKVLGPYRFTTSDRINYTLKGEEEVTLTFLTPNEYRLIVPDSDTTLCSIKPGLYSYLDFYEPSGEDKIQWGGTFSMDQRPRMIEFNFKGYNLAKIDPINYQVNTGSSKMLFDYPDEDSYDYYYSSVGKIIPYGLTLRNDREAMSRARSHHVMSEESHQGAWSNSLGFNVGMEGASFGLNANFKNESSTMAKTDNLYSIAMAHETKYAVVLDKARMKLNSELEEAVYKLRDLWLMRGYTQLASLVDGTTLLNEGVINTLHSQKGRNRITRIMNDTINTHEWLKPYLQEFIETFGTHYPYAVTYGGMAYQKIQYEDSALTNTDGTASDISAGASANLEGATAGFSVGSSESKSEAFSAELKDQSSDVYTVGGDISFSGEQSSWSLPDHSEVPIFLDLRPISELLSPLYFQDSVIWIYLRKHLENELEAYQQSIPRMDKSIWESDTVETIYEFEITSIWTFAPDDPGSDGEWSGSIKVQADATVFPYTPGIITLTPDPSTPSSTYYSIPSGTGTGAAKFLSIQGETVGDTTGVIIVVDVLEIDYGANADDIVKGKSDKIKFSDFGTPSKPDKDGWNTGSFTVKEHIPLAAQVHGLSDENQLNISYRYRITKNPLLKESE